MNKKNDKNICLYVFFITFAKSLILLHCKMSIQEMSLKLE